MTLSFSPFQEASLNFKFILRILQAQDRNKSLPTPLSLYIFCHPIFSWSQSLIKWIEFVQSLVRSFAVGSIMFSLDTLWWYSVQWYMIESSYTCNRTKCYLTFNLLYFKYIVISLWLNVSTAPLSSKYKFWPVTSSSWKILFYSSNI